MNLFRSEEHVAAWLGRRSPGAAIPVELLGRLGHAWDRGRISPDWVPHTRRQNHVILESLGLVGEFWRLP
jgi:hypothetical protein